MNKTLAINLMIICVSLCASEIIAACIQIEFISYFTNQSYFSIDAPQLNMENDDEILAVEHVDGGGVAALSFYQHDFDMALY